MRILCVREFQASIAESFFAELKAALDLYPWLAAHYHVGADTIKGHNGTEFIFRGLRRNEQSIKSLAKIDLTIVEEAEAIPESSWLLLEATVFRQPHAELWALWNPEFKNSPVDRRFRQHPPEGLVIEEVNYSDNPFFPAGLERLRKDQLKTLDEDVYNHIWLGKYLEGVKGAYYRSQIDLAYDEERVGFFPRHDMNKIYAIMDIGSTSTSADATAMWIVQFVGEEVRWLNYYEAIGQEMSAHVAWLRSNNYGDAVVVLPHDGKKHDVVYSVTPQSFLRQAGFSVEVIPNQGRGAAMARIYALRGIFGRCRFDEAGCTVGLDTLRVYHEKFDDVRNIGLGPNHDFSSHCADAAGAVAVFAGRMKNNGSQRRKSVKRGLAMPVAGGH